MMPDVPAASPAAGTDPVNRFNVNLASLRLSPNAGTGGAGGTAIAASSLPQ